MNLGQGQPSLQSEVCALMAAHVPPLHHRLRTAVLEELARLVAEREEEAEFRDQLTPRGQLVSVILHLRRVLEDLRAQRRDADDAFAHVADGFATASDPKQLRAKIVEHLRTTAPNWWTLRGDIRALRRFLDVDALRERHARSRDLRLRHEELALVVTEGMLEALLAGPEPERSQAVGLLLRSDLAVVLATTVLGSFGWRERLSAANGLRHLGELGAQLSPEHVDRLAELSAGLDEDPFVVGATLAALLQIDRSRALAVAEHRLLDPPDDRPRDFLARRAVFDALVERPEAGRDLILRKCEAGDPSEHVRMGLCEGLAREALGFEGLEVLGQACTPPPHGVESSSAVRSWAVRLLVEATAADLLEERADGAARVNVMTEAVCGVLEHESEHERVAAACRLVTAVVDPHVPPTAVALSALARLETVAAGVARDPGRPPVVQEAAATLRQVLLVWATPRLRRAWSQLRDLVTEIGVSGSCSTADAELLALEPDDFGRVLAVEANGDFGLDVRVADDALKIRRGDRHVRRLWRVLHELRNRAPNKRQGHLHTIGRQLGGNVRAHSGQLHEATATTVPGERVFIEHEGGWGRHLPLVDDIVGLPLVEGDSVRIYSSHGVTEVVPPATPLERVKSRLRIALRYTSLAALRRRSLASDNPGDRGAYVRALEEQLGVTVTFTGIDDDASAQVRSLFGAKLPAIAALPLPVDSWLQLHSHYFLSMEGNTQSALGFFSAGLLALFASSSYLRRRRIRRARDRIGLSIGGWGTRGKSGTERLKAALLHGAGFDVFSKTTGCEAMFLHTVPGGGLEEVFSFRPYGKATIWEQMTTLDLASRLGADVFLWECMALNPDYVRILQQGWMRDDYATITNAYPDHEDVQGPSGADVASVIAEFIPKRSVLLTSEKNWLPLFRQRCREQSTRCIALGEDDDAMIAEDLLRLFPYSEHPRNIALVTALAEELGLDRTMAVVWMADHVVADLGVLKTYPRVRVRGRSLQFTNGCSANERTGFLASWRRIGFDAPAEEHPERFIVTVVNNRDDRISRSEVFARIIVEDIDVDRHVLIGTNLGGLRGYIASALESYVANITVVRRDEEGHKGAAQRLNAVLGRTRASADAALVSRRLQAMARGIGRSFEPTGLQTVLEDRLTGSVELPEVLAELRGDEGLTEALRASLGGPEANDTSELVESPGEDAFFEHACQTLARAVVAARLHARLASVREGRVGVETFHAELRSAFRSLFMASVVTIEDPNTKGDAIVSECALVSPPGFDVQIMGMQNIKGTGLDFVYRWLAVQAVDTQIAAFESGNESQRAAALEALERFADHGQMDLAMLRHFAKTAHRRTEAEELALDRLAARAAPHETALAVRKTSSFRDRMIRGAERWLDFLDSVYRERHSRKVAADLATGRISHPRAAVEMRRVYSREKGGWLASVFGRKS